MTHNINCGIINIMKFAVNLIFLIIMLFITIFIAKILFDIQYLKNSVDCLRVNENLILLQLQDEENNVNNIEKEIDKINFLINKYSNQYGVEKSLAHAVAIVESGKKQNVVSRSGSVGIYQLQPDTADFLGVNPYSTEENIKGGIKYLAYLHKKFDYDIDLILASYNSGMGNVNKYNGVPPFVETKKYIDKVKQEKYKIDNKNN